MKEAIIQAVAELGAIPGFPQDDCARFTASTTTGCKPNARSRNSSAGSAKPRRCRNRNAGPIES